MNGRGEILTLIDQAIDAHRCNIAKVEIRKAELGLAAPDVLDDEIRRSSVEIDRLVKMRNHVEANGKSTITNQERLEFLSAQISTVQGEVSMLSLDMRSCASDIADTKEVIRELRDGCPLFDPDTPEGPLVFVKKRPQVQS